MSTANRLDSPGHQAAKWTEADSERARPGPSTTSIAGDGPVAAEVFHVFKGRDEAHLSDAEIASRPAKDVPVVPVLSELHKGAATSSRWPRPRSNPHRAAGIPLGAQGNATTHNTFVKAIRAAREHIYIEEQYMVPSDDYMAALVGAADNCERLIILLPSFLEVYFGDRKRGNFFKDLSLAWGDRLFIGTPMRQPVLDPPGRTTSKGRLTLLADIDGGARTVCSSGPPPASRPAAFSVWANGELMYVTGSPTRWAPTTSRRRNSRSCAVETAPPAGGARIRGRTRRARR